jgi:DNA-binding MarR family transcriptional regulator
VLSERQRATDHDFVDDVMQQYVAKFEWADTDSIALSYRVTAAYVATRAATQRLLTSLGHERAAGKIGVLRSLYFAPDHRMSQNEISNNMNVASASVTYIVDALARDGLVQRTRHPSDRRVSWVGLTPEGLSLFDALAQPLTEHLENLARGFTEDEKRIFSDLLIRYRKNADSA